jgi:hypothetical protein
MFIRHLLLKRIVYLTKQLHSKFDKIYKSQLLYKKIPNKYKEILNKNLQFKNLHLNKRALIVVNGPSINTQKLEKFENDIIFSVNAFYKHKNISKLQPKYNFLLDSNLFNNETINTSLFYDELLNTLTNTIFFLPLFRGYKSVIKNNILPINKTFFTAMGGDENGDLDFTSVIPSFHGVGAYALSAAIYMGCNPIYLVGFDHDYLANRGKDHHFYQGSTVSVDNKEELSLADRIPYDDEMLSNYYLWQNYRYLLKIACKKGIKVFNATNGGFLDVFDRYDFDKIS